MEKEDPIPPKEVGKRAAFLSRLREKHPEKDFEDEDVRYGQITDDFDALESENAAMRKNEQRLTGMFNSNPKAAAMMVDWMDGKDPVLTLVKRFGPELSEVLTDPEKQEALAEAQQEYLERVTKEHELEEEYQQNLSASLEEIESLQSELGLSEAEVDKAIELLLRIVNEGVMGKFSRESLQLAMHALNHDADVAAADREGEVRGKNAKIEEKLRRKASGDGTAVLGGHHGGGTTAPKARSIFDLAKEAR